MAAIAQRTVSQAGVATKASRKEVVAVRAVARPHQVRFTTDRLHLSLFLHMVMEMDRFLRLMPLRRRLRLLPLAGRL